MNLLEFALALVKFRFQTYDKFRQILSEILPLFESLPSKRIKSERLIEDKGYSQKRNLIFLMLFCCFYSLMCFQKFSADCRMFWDIFNAAESLLVGIGFI